MTVFRWCRDHGWPAPAALVVAVAVEVIERGASVRLALARRQGAGE